MMTLFDTGSVIFEISTGSEMDLFNVRISIIMCYGVVVFNSFTAAEEKSRLLQNSIDPDETAHLDLGCFTCSLSTLHINVFPNDSLLK